MAVPALIAATARRAASAVLPHDNRRTVCPPGSPVLDEGPTVIVATLKRTGTHLVIDLLLNELPALRHRPLYVDWDAWVRAGRSTATLRPVSGIIKTHVPQVGAADGADRADLLAVAGRSVVVTTRRDPAEAARSLERAEAVPADPAAMAALAVDHDALWAPLDPITVAFGDLLDPAARTRLVAAVAERCGLRGPAGPVAPVSASAGAVLRDKLATRLLGRRAPRIDTGVGYKLPGR